MVNKLQDKQTLEKLDNLADLMIEQNLVKESKRLIMAINLLFKKNHLFFKNNPSLQRRYEHYLIRAKLVTLFDLDEDEILKLINDNLADILSLTDYDLYEKIRQKMTTIYDLEKRDQFKEKLKAQLLVNQGVITSGKIKVNDLAKRPTIGNWLKDYYSKTGLDPVDSLKKNQYLINNINTKHLTSQERDKLKRLINFFEKLKLSSNNMRNLEEKITIILPDGEVAVINNGEIEKPDPNILKTYREVVAVEKKEEIDDVVSSDEKKTIEDSQLGVSNNQEEYSNDPRRLRLEFLEKSLKNYSASSLEYKAIQQEINKLNKKR